MIIHIFEFFAHIFGCPGYECSVSVCVLFICDLHPFNMRIVCVYVCYCWWSKACSIGFDIIRFFVSIILLFSFTPFLNISPQPQIVWIEEPFAFSALLLFLSSSTCHRLSFCLQLCAMYLLF